MYKQCQTDRSEKRQELIAKTLMKLLQTRSFYSITVTELCQRAEIPRKAFYRYFDSMEDIIRYIVDRVLLRFSEKELKKEPNSAPNDQEYCIELFRFWYDRPELLRVLTSQECFGLFSTAVTACVLEKELGFSHSNSVGHHRRLAAIFSSAGFTNLLVYWCHNGLRESPEEMGILMQKLNSEPLYQ